mmetsp:Transcript_55162/g.81003  ORF Transcript_55162/g.81003 Transcript_55162/m.81003 type:complete len:213 (+) Transcript_55162:553-1191(+)
MRRGTTQHKCARLTALAALEGDELVLANDDLLDTIARAHLDHGGVVKGRGDLAAKDGRKTLDALEVGMFNRHDAVVREVLLGLVVNKLAVNKDVAADLLDLVALGHHLAHLGRLDLGNLCQRVHLDLSAVDLDLVSVHGRVGNKHLAAIEALGLPHTDLLVEDEALGKKGVTHAAALFLDNAHVLQIARALEAHHSFDADFGKEVVLDVHNL